MGLKDENEFNFTVIDEVGKQIEFNFQGKILKFQLKKRRAFAVLIKIAEVYPIFFDIHDLDGIYNDPNRAYSDLKQEDGFAPFIVVKVNTNRTMSYKLNVEKIFDNLYHSEENSEVFLDISSASSRRGLSNAEKIRLREQFNDLCNLTGIKLYEKKDLSGSYFFKHAMLIEYDHRIPLSKGGSNDLVNFQILSKLANKEKNKICNGCSIDDCENCALAFPEKNTIILANNQDISKFKEIFFSKNNFKTLEKY